MATATTVAWTLGGAVAGLAGWATWGVWNNLTAFPRGRASVRRAGFAARQVDLDGVRVAYGEGPDNGPALLLIHGQSTDWLSYAPVLPQLARRHHVYAVDCLGHGASARAPQLYSAAAHGAFLGRFLDEVIGRPTLVSGHSSGGHLAAWLAAHHGGVCGVLLEDPPFFTTTLPRALTTWNYVDLATMAHTFLAEGGTDWVAYVNEHQRIWQFFGGSADWFTRMGRAYHRRHRDEPTVYWAMPPMMNESVRGAATYDPRFGDAFYTGSWDEGWDQAATLASLGVPATLVHTKVAYDDDGILMAAMGHEEAARARALLRDVRFVTTQTGHGFHLEDPARFVALIDELAARA